MKVYSSQLVVVSLCFASILGCSSKRSTQEKNQSPAPVAQPVANPDAGQPQKPTASLFKIQFSSTLSDSTKSALKKDFEFLSKLELDESKSTDLKKVMKLNKADAQSLMNWLDLRVKLIVPPTFDDTTAATYSSMELDWIGSESAMTIADNLGAFLYKDGKRRGKNVSLDVPGLGSISVRSPRAGIIREGKGLMVDWPDTGDITDAANTVLRLATLFHEGRHSDGHDASLCFSHVKCPKGHVLEDSYACDNNKNGPYTIGAQFVKAYMDSCTDCSTKFKNEFKLEIADNLGRVISTDEWDDTPEGQI
jgi:hypothetical protein